MKLDFISAAKTGRWKVAGASLTGECEGVTFAGERAWWGGRWTITGEAPFAMPEKVLLFISEEGPDHGYWRDMTAGGAQFDYRHFVFCDTPGLLRLIVGPSTREAMLDREPGHKPIIVYARNGFVRTTGKHDASEERAIARHVAIHRALAKDYELVLATWQTRLASASGRGASTWPPTGQINSRVGTLSVGLTWELPPESRDAAEWESGYVSLRTEVSAFGDRDKPRWVLDEVGYGVPSTHQIGRRQYRLRGTPSVPIARIANLVEEADLVALAFGPKLTVSLRDLASERRLQAAVGLVEQLLAPQARTTSPYR
ncbi:MAG: hypothetical protein AB7T06_11635 [Kofleriaceae bacterium]